MKKTLMLVVVSLLAVMGIAGTATAANRYSSCAALLKDYPRGVAQSTAAATAAVKAGFLQPSMRPLIYQENGGRLDVDDDGVMCEQVNKPKPGDAAARKRAAYLADLHQRGMIGRATDDTLYNTGRSICRLLDAGGNFQILLDTAESAGVDAGDAAKLIISSVDFLCPGHTQFLENYIDTIR